MGNKKTYIIGKSLLAQTIEQLCRLESDKLDVLQQEHSDGLIAKVNASIDTKIIFLLDPLSDDDARRDHNSAQNYNSTLRNIRENRKDIFVVGFDETKNLDSQQQYRQGLHLLKENSANLVFSYDGGTGLNMIIAPEETTYHATADRASALQNLVQMAYLRSHLTFTRSTVVAGEPIPWNSPVVPAALRTVVNYCIAQGAYKVFNGATTGHFAAKLDEKTFLTSRRKTNFNDLDKIGLVKIKTDGPDTVIAYGSKPSVGGQSQRIVFERYPEYDSIVHFHCPKKENSLVPIVSQREYECGSHECGKNTASGLQQFGNLVAVYLDNHGPNIVFHSSIDPQEVISFIEKNFDLALKTGGYVA